MTTSVLPECATPPLEKKENKKTTTKRRRIRQSEPERESEAQDFNFSNGDDSTIYHLLFNQQRTRQAVFTDFNLLLKIRET